MLSSPFALKSSKLVAVESRPLCCWFNNALVASATVTMLDENDALLKQMQRLSIVMKRVSRQSGRVKVLVKALPATKAAGILKFSSIRKVLAPVLSCGIDIIGQEWVKPPAMSLWPPCPSPLSKRLAASVMIAPAVLRNTAPGRAVCLWKGAQADVKRSNGTSMIELSPKTGKFVRVNECAARALQLYRGLVSFIVHSSKTPTRAATRNRPVPSRIFLLSS